MKRLQKLLFVFISSMFVFSFTLVPLVDSQKTEKESMQQNYKEIHDLTTQSLVLMKNMKQNKITTQYVKASAQELMQQTIDMYTSYASANIQPTYINDAKRILQLNTQLLITLKMLIQEPEDRNTILLIQKNLQKINNETENK